MGGGEALVEEDPADHHSAEWPGEFQDGGATGGDSLEAVVVNEQCDEPSAKGYCEEIEKLRLA